VAAGGLRALLTGLLAALSLSLAILPSSAEALVEEVGGTKVGLQPREESHYWEGSAKLDGLGKNEGEPNLPVASFNNNPLHLSEPGPVLHSAETYTIFWDPQDYYHGDWQGLIDRFTANLGSAGGKLNNVFAVDTQYTDATNNPATNQFAFHGAYTDTNPYPENEGCTDPHPLEFGIPLLASSAPVCLTDKQVRTQLETFISAQHGIRKGMGAIFYLLTPPGVTVCLDGGGAAGHCSDFAGNPPEISLYEEARMTYPERLTKWEEEEAAYEKAKEAYELEKTEKEKKGEEDTNPPPVEPSKPVAPTQPAAYPSYKRSLCSYHSDISPTSPTSGDENTILYAVIPWTAGGAGDYHLSSNDRTQAAACQDGGFKSSTQPGGELEEKEREKPKTRKEEEEFAEKSRKEQREAEEARELGLEKAHDEEPNQIGLGPDGSYDTGLADLIVNQIAVEQQNTVTDPLLNAWQDSAGSEVTDECRNAFFPLVGGGDSASPLTRAGTLANQTLAEGNYYLNDAFNLASQRLPYPGVPCMNNISLVPDFTAPNPVNSGEVLGFDGMESNITLDAAIGFAPSHPRYATFTWNFGDGSAPVTGVAPGAPSANSPATSPCALPWEAPCAASAYHTYQYGGTYTVTLTVTDVGGHTGSVSKPVTVDGPPPPSSEQPAGGGSGGGSGNTAAGGSAGAPGSSPAGTPAATTLPPTPPPVLAAAVTSKSLKKALNSGLPVRYSANEQVAGSVQVLLDGATAKRLGVHGVTATGLPAGTPRSIVVGSAVLVTTKAGQGTLHIKFSPRTAARLKHVRKLKLMLRLFARNASRVSPQTTTVLSTVVLNP
jgi:hypothetical protein